MIQTLNIASGKEKCIAQLNQWAEMMHSKINQKYNELQLELDRLDREIEASRENWKKVLLNRMETKVGCVLTVQSQKDEVDEVEYNEAQDEFVRLKELFHLFSSQPMISLLNVENNQEDLNTPRLVFPSITADSFNWMENFSMENTVQTMEYSDQQPIDIDENINYRSNTGNYDLNSQQKSILFDFFRVRQI
jgi:hypothetical protein